MRYESARKDLFYGIILVCIVMLTIALLDAIHTLTPQASAALANVGAIEKNSAEMLNATYASEGSIANLFDTVNGIADTFAKSENANMKQAQDTGRKLDLLFQHADEAAVSANQTIIAAKDTIVSLKEPIGSMNTAIVSLKEDSHATLGAATDILANPDIKTGLDNFATISKSAAEATTSGAHAIAKVDEGVTYEVDNLKAPVKKVVIAYRIALDVIHRLFF